MWQHSLNTLSSCNIFNNPCTRRVCFAHSQRLGAKHPIFPFAMAPGRNMSSVSAALHDNRQSQEQHAEDDNTDVNAASNAGTQLENLLAEGQKRSLDVHSRPQQDQQQTVQHPQSAPQATNTNGAPIRHSRRLQQRAQRDALLNVREGGHIKAPQAPSQISFPFNNYNDNHNHNTNTASGPYMIGNDLGHIQNLKNRTNFRFVQTKVWPSQSDETAEPSALKKAQLLHIQFAQQMLNGATQGKDKNVTIDEFINQHTKREPSEPVAPIPSPSYLDGANKEPQDLNFYQPLLIILDLNGTLLYRKHKKFPPKFVRRPALNYFLERITTRHKIMVWSSSRRQTVDAICKDIFSQKQQEKLIARWNRDQLGLTPKQFNSKVQVYKELEKIWADPHIQRKYPHKKEKQGKSIFHVERYHPGIFTDMEMTGAANGRWDQSNTILIDDSELKAAGNPYNILEVPEFTNSPNDDDDTVLKAVLKTINILAKSNDVSRRLRSWKEQGIRINWDDILELSDSQSDDNSSAAEPRQLNESIEEPHSKGNMIFNTENDIVPVELPERPSIIENIPRNKHSNLTRKEAKRAKVAQRKAEKKAMKEAETAEREGSRHERKYRKETRLARNEFNKGLSTDAGPSAGPSVDSEQG